MAAERAPRRPERSSREAFIDTTAKLLRRRGYAASGLNEIVARSGAPKGSLYFHFPGGKEELAIAAMEHAGGAAASGHRRSCSPRVRTSARRSPRSSTRSPAGLQASGFRDGCPIATVALETASESEPAARERGGGLRLLARGDRARACARPG